MNQLKHQLKRALLAGAAGVALMAAPIAASAQTSTTVITNTGTTVYPAPATTGSVTTVTTTTATPASPHLADPVAHLEAMGYSGVEQTPGVALESQMAFNAVNEWGHPVTIVMDRRTGEVVRETSKRTLDTPSKQ